MPASYAAATTDCCWLGWQRAPRVNDARTQRVNASIVANEINKVRQKTQVTRKRPTLSRRAWWKRKVSAVIRKKRHRATRRNTGTPVQSNLPAHPFSLSSIAATVTRTLPLPRQHPVARAATSKSNDGMRDLTRAFSLYHERLSSQAWSG